MHACDPVYTRRHVLSCPQQNFILTKSETFTVTLLRMEIPKQLWRSRTNFIKLHKICHTGVAAHCHLLYRMSLATLSFLNNQFMSLVKKQTVTVCCTPFPYSCSCQVNENLLAICISDSLQALSSKMSFSYYQMVSWS